MNEPSFCNWKRALAPLKAGLLMLAHYFTVLLLAGLAFFCISSPLSTAAKVTITVTVLYLFPPLLARIVLLFFPIKRGHIPFGSRDFIIWWSLFSFQTIYLRFPFLEELLRSIPGLYSLWLRFWGSKIGKATYWAAGVSILDRSFLCIGDHVMIGAGVRFAPHVNIQDDDGKSVLLLEKITIGSRCLLGGYSLLTAGTVLHDDEHSKACLVSPPFSEWKNNHRIKNAHDC